ncbi:MAG: insulinase family protein [Abditibacteriota bacterium]|nr:insulinase family protein [Abditibacteriota bacterium]
MRKTIAVNAGCREFFLENGLKILIKENRSVPLFTCQLWFRAGSADEPEGLYGAAHFTEHMLFRSTRDFPSGEMTRRLRLLGGTENAATSRDYTYYWTVMPPEGLEFAVEMMSQRFLALFPPDELETERQIVLSELEGGEDSPARRLYRQLCSRAYVRSAYSRPVIGFRQDLEAMSREGLVGFYNTFYVPSNAVLVFVGDVDEKQALDLSRKYLGPLAAAPAPERKTVKEPPQTGRTDCLVPCGSPMAEAGFHIPDMHHPDADALSLLGYILSYGVTGRLYKGLVETGLAAEIWAYPEVSRQPSLFIMGAEGKPGVTPEQLTEALLEQTEQIKAAPVTREEIERAITQTRADIIYDNLSVAGQGETLGYSEVMGGWRLYDAGFENLFRVGPEDICRAANAYLFENNLTVAKSVSAKETYADIPAMSPVPETDRVFEARPAGAVRKPPVKIVLDNGLTAVIYENRSAGSVSVTGHLHGGGAYEGEGERLGFSLLSQMLLRGTDRYDSLQLNGLLEAAGAELDFSGSRELVKLSGKCLSEDADLLLSVAARALGDSVFPAEELEKVKDEALSEIAYGRAVPGFMAAGLFNSLAVPAGDPRRGLAPDEAEAAVRACERETLLGLYERFVRPDNLTLAICGDVDADKAADMVRRRFGGWAAPAAPLPSRPPVPEYRLDGIRREDFPMEGKSEVCVVFGGASGINKAHPDYPSVCIANHILGGGSIGSRLGRLIREDSGLAYGVGSAFKGYFLNNIWSCSFGTHPERLREALETLLEGICDFQTGNVTEEELLSAKSHLIGAEKRSLSVNTGMCAALETAVLRGLDMDFPWKIEEYYQSATLDSVNEACRKYFSGKKGLLVCAGGLL